MNLINVEKLGKKFGDKVLFQELSFGIEKGERTGLIAPNGTGKSTLLKILAGIETPDSGQVTTKNNIQVALLEQEPHFDPEATLINTLFSIETPIGNALIHYKSSLANDDKDALSHSFQLMEDANAWDYESQAEQVLSKLKINNLNVQIKTLSGGQKRRLALAKLLLSDADLLLMDEPTNHLDIEMIEWLEKYLTGNNKSLLLITHDRYFLDNVCNRILEIDQHKLYFYQGNYNYFLEKRQERYEQAAASLAKNKNIFKRELEWIRKQPKARTTKSQSRIDAFDVLSEKAKSKIEERQLALGKSMRRLGNKVIEAHKLGMKFEGQEWLFRNFDYHFIPGERVGIIGNNGSGKSTLIKTLCGYIKPSEGHIEIGETITIGYFGQEGLQWKQGQKIIDLVEAIADTFTTDQGSTITPAKLLETFLFPSYTHYTPIENLSGGEKRRLNLMLTLLKEPNLLILDEPTNDLDLLTLNVLEDYLSVYPGTLIIISHDRYFMDKLVDHVFVFEGTETLKDFPGNYTQYRLWAKEKEKDLLQEKKSQENLPKKQIIIPPKEIIPQVKLTYKEKLLLEQLPFQIQTKEEEKVLLTKALAEAGNNYTEMEKVSEKLNKIIAELNELELKWLELSERC
jgi:ATP-binding cassette subfamily F protein uup